MTKTKQMRGGKSTPYKNYKKCIVCRCYKSEDIAMHRMPTNHITRMLWSAATGKKLFPTSLICSNHFKQSDYHDNTTNRLKPGAIPSQFISIVQNQTILQSAKSLDSSLSNQNNEKSDSQEEEQCYIYYLDEEQNVSVFESPALRTVNNASKSDKSNEAISPLNTEINQENSSSNMNIDMTQSVSNSYTEAKSLEVSSNQCLNEYQNLSLEPFIGLNSSHFTTKLAWQTFCDIVSEYREEIYHLQDNNNILRTKINRLKELLNNCVTKI